MSGQDPNNLLFEKSMRLHLLQCLEKEELTPFPFKTVKRNRKSRRAGKINIIILQISNTEGRKHNIYSIAGKFGGEFNLAVWRSPTASPNLISDKLTSAISARKNYVKKFCFAIANRQILIPPLYLISAVGGKIAKYNSCKIFRLYDSL